MAIVNQDLIIRKIFRMNGIGYIYKITNNINGKIYVGKTKQTIESRYKRHLANAEKYKELQQFSSRLYLAMLKYGVENFSVEQLEECPYEVLDERERFWIKELDARNGEIGYNICKGGECGPGGPMFQGHHHSEETRAKMSADRTGEKNSNYGNRWTQSAELRAKHSEISRGEGNGMYGKHHLEDSKEKMRQYASSRCWVNDGETSIRISKDDLELYILAGYVRGRAPIKKN